MNVNRLITGFLLASSLLAAGCNNKVAVRNPDGSITNPDGSVTFPAASGTAQQEAQPGAVKNTDGSVTVPATSAPARHEVAANPVPAAAPSAPAPPARATVPAGASVVVRINTSLAASRNDVGDHFTGVLDAPLQVNGETIFAAGTPVSGEVVSAKGKGRFEGAGDLGISVTEIGRHAVETSVYEKNSPGRGKRTTGFVAGGAGLGALIGGLAGHGKGALIGGLAGAGAGTAAGAYSGNRDVVIPAESRINFRVTQSFTR